MGLLICHSGLVWNKRGVYVCLCMEMNVYEVSQWGVSTFPSHSSSELCLNWESEQASGLFVCPDRWSGSTWVRESTVSVDHPRVGVERLLVDMEDPPHSPQSGGVYLQGLSPLVMLPLIEFQSHFPLAPDPQRGKNMLRSLLTLLLLLAVSSLSHLLTEAIYA